MIQIIRHHCVGRRRLGTALAFGLLAASAMSAHAGTVIVTGANGAPGALGKPGGAGASATATATSSDQSNSATAIGGNGGVGGPGGAASIICPGPAQAATAARPVRRRLRRTRRVQPQRRRPPRVGTADVGDYQPPVSIAVSQARAAAVARRAQSARRPAEALARSSATQLPRAARLHGATTTPRLEPHPPAPPRAQPAVDWSKRTLPRLILPGLPASIISRPATGPQLPRAPRTTAAVSKQRPLLLGAARRAHCPAPPCSPSPWDPSQNHSSRSCRATLSPMPP